MPFRTEYMSPLEGAWVLVAVVGLTFTGWALVSALGDLAYLRRAGLNGPRLIVAKQSRRREWTRVGEMLLLLLIGVGSLTRANASTAITPAQIIYTLLAFYVPVVQTANSIKERVDRARLLAYMKAAEEARDALATEQAAGRGPQGTGA